MQFKSSTATHIFCQSIKKSNESNFSALFHFPAIIETHILIPSCTYIYFAKIKIFSPLEKFSFKILKFHLPVLYCSNDLSTIRFFKHTSPYSISCILNNICVYVLHYKYSRITGNCPGDKFAHITRSFICSELRRITIELYCINYN